MGVFTAPPVVGVNAINIMKSSLSNGEFTELCIKIVEYNKLN